MAKSEERLAAQKLRQNGESITDIAKKLRVSKSVVSLWCRDIKLTSQQTRKLLLKKIRGGMAGRMAGARMNRERRLSAVHDGREAARLALGKLNSRDRLLAATSLYWAEGTKARSRFLFVNSDPHMIKFMADFLEKDQKIPRHDLMPRLQINVIHKNRIGVVLRFWAKLLRLPISQFGNPNFVKTKIKKVYENHDSYYGILRLQIRNGAKTKYYILGLIEELRDQAMSG